MDSYTVDPYTEVERALRAADPHQLLDVVTTTLRDRYHAVDVVLRMADYSMQSLQKVEAVPLASEPVPISGTPHGRAFGAAQPIVSHDRAQDLTTVHLPVTVRGERVGLLSVGFPGGTDVEALAPELESLAEVLGHEIMVAERDTDLYLMARRAKRLTLAAEIQWQLLPGRSCCRREFTLGAQLEPAYNVLGDNYDWSTSADHLTLTVTNGQGQGIEAAMLTNLAVSALRNARRGGLGIADQAALADQAIYAQHRGDAHVAVLLMRFSLATGEVEVVEAGSPRLWRMREGKVEEITFDAQLPLGMWEDTDYSVERLHLEPGDRLLVASDGVYNSAAPSGRPFGEQMLGRFLRDTRLLPAPQVPTALLQQLAGYRGAGPLDDDAAVVCLDWHGRS